MVDSHDAETYSAKDSRLIWIDCEMTGLDIVRWRRARRGVSGAYRFRPQRAGRRRGLRHQAVRRRRRAHERLRAAPAHPFRLINEWEHGLSLEEAERKVTEYVLRFTPDGVRPLLAGNTIGSDKKFLDHYMPGLMSHLHYRSVDVSTLKELARRWYPAVYENRPAKNGGHRALADIIESLDELRYYRQAFMEPAPGPNRGRVEGHRRPDRRHQPAE